jgi:hypothetical protein
MPVDTKPILARAEAATPGPWIPGLDEGVVFKRISDRHYATIISPGDAPDDHQPRSSDVEFIAHAREDVPALVAEVERLQAENSLLKAIVEDLPKCSVGSTCDTPATRHEYGYDGDEFHWCEAHGRGHSWTTRIYDLPYAVPLRAYLKARGE